MYQLTNTSAAFREVNSKALNLKIHAKQFCGMALKACHTLSVAAFYSRVSLSAQC